MPSLFDGAGTRINAALQHVTISDETAQRLAQPDAALKVSVPLRHDDGRLTIFSGYRVRYDTTLGPAKGGIRFHPDVDAAEVSTLAFWMTLKCALTGLPFGGGKGGVAVDPKHLSPAELERLARTYIDRIADFIGPDADIPAPDVNTNPRIMGWMMDQYAIINRGEMREIVTGKPTEIGGSAGRSEATGDGAFHALTTMMKRLARSVDGATVAVQGFGNAGARFAKRCARAGCRVVAVSDSSGAIYDPDGLDVDSVIAYKEAHRSLASGYSDGAVGGSGRGETLTNDELLALDVDILAPAALESVITPDNADRVQAGLIVEIANGPIAGDADAALAANGVIVVPDILANAGGAIVSYFEWVQNRQAWYWDADVVAERLEQRIVDAAKATADRAESLDVDYRTAAYVIALERIDAASVARGTTAYYRDDGDED